MATKTAIAHKLATAFDRLEAAMRGVGKQLDVRPVSVPRRGRDPEFLRAEQIEAMADWAERINRKLAKVLADQDTDHDPDGNGTE